MPMYLEAFTAAKDPQRPDGNEDRIVVVPEVAYAVIDGVTDKSGRIYDGRTGGQLAGALIERAIRDLIANEPFMTMPATDVAASLSARFVLAYRAHGIDEHVISDPNLRFAATLSLVLSDDDAFRFLLIGDCGLRINGDDLYRERHQGDRITSDLRALVYHAVADDAGEGQQRSDAARSYALEGMHAFLPGHRSSLDEPRWMALRAQALTELPDKYPLLPRQAVEGIVLTGIKGLARHRNADSPLGFGSLDGTTIPAGLLREFTLRHATVDLIELFSDGYFLVPDGTTVGHWEHRFSQLEREDPAKVTTAVSTKGSGDGTFTDDRTVMIIGRGPPPHA